MPFVPAALLTLASELELAAGLSRADVGWAGGAAEAEARQPDLLISPSAARDALTIRMCSRARSRGGREASFEVEEAELAAVEAVERAEVEADRTVEVVVELLAEGFRLEVVVARLIGGAAASSFAVRVVD